MHAVLASRLSRSPGTTRDAAALWRSGMTEPSRRAFLGVDAVGRRAAVAARLERGRRAAALAIAQRHGLPDLLARVLAGRGVGLDEADGFSRPADPQPDARPSRRHRHGRRRPRGSPMPCRRGETVAVFGDYDVDGARQRRAADALPAATGLDPIVYIPDRLFEGYGPNVEAIRRLAERGATLIVTVDCGTTSFEPLAEARRLGLDVVVIDHHQVAGALPPAVAVVNPNRAGRSLRPRPSCRRRRHLPDGGRHRRALRQRGFWTAAGRSRTCSPWLDLVALGTVCDVVPLIGLNRAFVAKGLLAMRRRSRPASRRWRTSPGSAGRRRPTTSASCSARASMPAGASAMPALGARLLASDDDIEARRIAAELDRLNGERQAIEKATVAEAEAEALAAMGRRRGRRCGGHRQALASRRRRPDRRAAQGTLRPAGHRHRLAAERHRHRFGPLDLGRRSRPRRARGGRGRHPGEGRRPRHGGRAHRRPRNLGALRAFLEEPLADEVAAARARDRCSSTAR